MKKQYRYNHELMSVLPQILQLTNYEFLKRIGRTNTLLKNCNERKDIRVKWLVDMCNEFHISITHFFCEGASKKTIPAKLFRDNPVFSPISFESERISDMCSGMIPGLSVKQLVEEMKISNIMYYNWINPEKETIYAGDLARLCNQYNLSPMYFFEDANAKDNNLMDVDLYIQSLLLENRRLKERINKLEQLIQK